MAKRSVQLGGPRHSPVLAGGIDHDIFFCSSRCLRGTYFLCDREAVFLCAPAAAGDRPVPRLCQGEGQQADGQVLRTVSSTHIRYTVLLRPLTECPLKNVQFLKPFSLQNIQFTKRPVSKRPDKTSM